MDPQAIFDNYKRIITQHYFDMNGRVGRSEFWYFVLANFIAALLVGLVGGIIGLPLGALYNLAVLLPVMSLGARRLQDIGKNGQLVWVLLFVTALSQIIAVLTALTVAFGGWYGLALLPGLSLVALACLVVGVVLIWFWCQPGDTGPNAYGPPPPRFDPTVKAAA